MVMPREHHRGFVDLSDDLAAHLFVVKHYRLHVIPRFAGDGATRGMRDGRGQAERATSLLAPGPFEPEP